MAKSLRSSLLISSALFGAVVLGSVSSQTSNVSAATTTAATQTETGSTTPGTTTSVAPQETSAAETTSHTATQVADNIKAISDTEAKLNSDTGSDETTKTDTTVSEIPAKQTVNLDGLNETVDATNEEYQKVGNHSTASVQPNDFGDNKDGSYNVTVQASDDVTNSEATTTGTEHKNPVVTLDAQTLFNGDTSHYAEKQNDGTWQVNSVTLANSEQSSSGTYTFDADVTSIVTGEDISRDYDLTDGVTVHVSSGVTSGEYENLVTGLKFNLSLLGTNAYDDIYHSQADSADDLAQSGESYVNMPWTFHYFKDGQIVTGILNLTNSKVSEVPDPEDPEVTIPETPDTESPEVIDPETPNTVTPEVPVTEVPTVTVPEKEMPESASPIIDVATTTKGETTDEVVTNNQKTSPVKLTDVKSTTRFNGTPGLTPIDKNNQSVKLAQVTGNQLPQTGESKTPLAKLGLVSIAAATGLAGFKLKKREI